MSEMVDDTLDGLDENEDELDEEAQEEVDKVLFQITDGKLGQTTGAVGALPVSQLPSHPITLVKGTMIDVVCDRAANQWTDSRGPREGRRDGARHPGPTQQLIHRPQTHNFTPTDSCGSAPIPHTPAVNVVMYYITSPPTPQRCECRTAASGDMTPGVRSDDDVAELVGHRLHDLFLLCLVFTLLLGVGVLIVRVVGPPCGPDVIRILEQEVATFLGLGLGRHCESENASH